MSRLWREVARFMRTKMAFSSMHHPQHDGRTEIVNKRLEVMLRAYVGKDKKDWASWLPHLQHAYNSVPHASTGLSPHRLLMGFQPRAFLDIGQDLNASSTALDGYREQGVKQYPEAVESHRQAAETQSQPRRSSRHARTIKGGDR